MHGGYNVGARHVRPCFHLIRALFFPHARTYVGARHVANSCKRKFVLGYRVYGIE